MFTILIAGFLLVFLLLAGTELLVEDANADELSNMGIERKA